MFRTLKQRHAKKEEQLLRVSQEILRLEHITKEFEEKDKSKLKAVTDVSLSMAKRECLGIVGESGCGKSTLAKLVTFIEPLTDGKIFFNGDDVTNIKRNDLRAYRREVQIIFQNPSNVFSPRMKIGQFLMEPWMHFEKLSKKAAKEQAYYALDRVHLSRDYFHKYPHQLSGGELQRIAIARAIALHPQLLICDEATSALDVSIQKQIIDLLREHQEEADFSILFISHDLALAENFCDRVAVMYLGRIVEVMNGKALRKNAKHPYAKALLESVFSVHDNPDEKIKILQGEPPSPINLPEGCVFCGRCQYATEQCRQKQPELRDFGDGHLLACYRE